MMLRPHLTHIAMRARDVDATIRFYETYAGLYVVHDRVDDGTRVVWLSEEKEEPTFVIVAIGIPPEERQKSPAEHLGYDLPSREAVNEIARRGEDAGILAQEPTYAGPVVGYFCILRDPDGNFVEFSHGQSINPRQ